MSRWEELGNSLKKALLKTTAEFFSFGGKTQTKWSLKIEYIEQKISERRCEMVSHGTASKNTIRMRSGSKQGSDHVRHGYNNQDALLQETFTIPILGKTFQVGFVSDGVSGIPMFSHTEVGSNLSVVYAYRRTLELICSGVGVVDIPKALFSIMTEFMLDLMHKVMPSTTHWPYPILIKKRKDWNSQERFRGDYLAATFLGLICDGEDIALFTSGDGVVVVNDTLEYIDQNDEPDYPAISINQPSKGFHTRTFKVSDVQRMAIMTDGLKHLVREHGFIDRAFGYMPNDPLGLQYLLNISHNERPDMMKDDCTMVSWEHIENQNA